MPNDAARALLDQAGSTHDDAFDPVATALALGQADDPACDAASAREAIAGLAASARLLLADNPEAAAGDARARANLIATVLATHGYRGDRETYDDEANANLARVVARRQGLPVALGLLWLGLARALGWPAAGLDFPGHFLLALEGATPATTPATPLVLDPFDSGRVLDAAAMEALPRRTRRGAAPPEDAQLPTMTPRQVVLRLANNLRVRRLDAARWDAALSITEDMLRFAPQARWLLPEAAQLAHRLGFSHRAEAQLLAFLAETPAPDEAEAARRLLQAVRQDLH
jgi:regulator of sirC expression with transglutaminase-like and TPR domain